MSGLLDHLVARAIGEADTVRPRPRLRFQSQDTPQDIEWTDGADVTEHLGSDQTVGSTWSANRPFQAARTTDAVSENLLSRHDQPGAVQSGTTDGRPAIGEPEVLASREPNEPQAAPLLAPLLPGGVEHPQSALEQKNAEEKSDTDDTTPPTPSLTEAVVFSREDAVGETLLPETPLADRAPEFIAPENFEQSPHDSERDSRAPTIRIGRIEVRPPAPAMKASPVSKLPVKSRAAPRQSLDAFLAKRRR